MAATQVIDQDDATFCLHGVGNSEFFRAHAEGIQEADAAVATETSTGHGKKSHRT